MIYGTNYRVWVSFQDNVVYFKFLGHTCPKSGFDMLAGVIPLPQKNPRESKTFMKIPHMGDTEPLDRCG